MKKRELDAAFAGAVEAAVATRLEQCVRERYAPCPPLQNGPRHRLWGADVAKRWMRGGMLMPVQRLRRGKQ